MPPQDLIVEVEPGSTIRVEPPRRRWPGLGLPVRPTPRRLLAAAGALLCLLVLAPSLFIGVACFRPGAAAAPPPPEVLEASASVAHYLRPEAATYLAFPAWHVVYTADAYAAFVREGPPSRFPYFRAIGQYWGAYRRVCAVTRRVYPFEAGRHLALGVGGASFTIEQAVKGLYEKTGGRVTEWISSHDSAEDRFAYETAQAYGGFLHTSPWYEFPFWGTLAALWRTTDLWGPHLLRKWERKVVLTVEYGMKGASAWVTRLGAKVVRGPADLVTHARVAGAPASVFAEPRIRRVRTLAPRVHVVSLPRHAAFTELARRLTTRNVRFLDVAGNDEILLTAIVPRDWGRLSEGGEILFAQPLLTDPARERVGVKASVRALHALLPALERRGARVEHLYDY